MAKEKRGYSSYVTSEEIETLRCRLREKEEIILTLEDKIAKQCDDKDGNIQARIFKKVEHLNFEVEKRLEKIHEHYQQKWRVKSEDFICEIADHKSRINVLIEEKEILMKQVSRYAGDGEGSEKMITYYKQLIVSKDCEINTFREKLVYFENLIYEKDESLEKMKIHCSREIESIRQATIIEIQTITQKFELQLIDARNNGNLEEVLSQRDIAFDKIIELDKHIEDLVCNHCKELKTAHLTIWELKEKMNSQSELIEITKINVKELYDLRKWKSDL